MKSHKILSEYLARHYNVMVLKINILTGSMELPELSYYGELSYYT